MFFLILFFSISSPIPGVALHKKEVNKSKERYSSLTVEAAILYQRKNYLKIFLHFFGVSKYSKKSFEVKNSFPLNPLNLIFKDPCL